jgi:hypothetical protein
MRFFAEQLERCDAGAITFKKMFGEYGVYADGAIFALACDDRLFFKVKHLEDHVVDELFENREQPYDGANGYAEVSGDLIEDLDALEPRVRTVLATLPPPRPKKKRS